MDLNLTTLHLDATGNAGTYLVSLVGLTINRSKSCLLSYCTRSQGK